MQSNCRISTPERPRVSCEFLCSEKKTSGKRSRCIHFFVLYMMKSIVNMYMTGGLAASREDDVVMWPNMLVF